MKSASATRNQYRTQQRTQKRLLADLRRIWRGMGGDWDTSWARISPDVVGAVSEAQLKIAESATAYMDDFLEQVDLPNRPVATVEASSLIGFSSDGYPLDSLLYGSVVTAREAAKANDLNAPQALKEGSSWLGKVASTQIADAGRVATMLGTSVRDDLAGYTRFLNPPSCQRCSVLAGRVYRYSTGFKRHPQCFPAGTLVSGPATLGATRRWYEGELVIIRSASGKKLSATGNHPILTDRGWVPANLLLEGDQVVSRASGDRAVALTVPNEDQMPALIEDVWRAGRMSTLCRVPVSPEDFHGDGVGSSHVDAVLADRLLRDGVETSVLEHASEQLLALASILPVPLSNLGPADEFFVGGLLASSASMSSLNLVETFGWAHLGGPKQSGLALMPDRHFGLDESAANDDTAEAGRLRDRILGLAGQISLNKGAVVDRKPFDARWDAPSIPFSLENGSAYAGRGLDLLDRLASQVHLDRLISVERVHWSGHVYDLTSSEGWFDANGLIVSNCDCLMVPAASAGWAKSEGFVLDPTEDLSNIKDLTKGQRAAIEAGADYNQVLNASRGMTTVGEGARRRQITTSGTTARGTYGRAEIAKNGQVVRGASRSQGAVANYRLSSAATPRLTPQQIMRQARDRDELIEYLRKYKYIYRRL